MSEVGEAEPQPQPEDEAKAKAKVEPAGVAAVAGLVVAGGGGRRMGMPKALVRDEWDRSWLMTAIETMREAGCSPVVVVIGAEADQVRALLARESRAHPEVGTAIGTSAPSLRSSNIDAKPATRVGAASTVGAGNAAGAVGAGNAVGAVGEGNSANAADAIDTASAGSAADAGGALDTAGEVVVVEAAGWREGMSASLRVGLEALGETTAGAVVVTLVDLPGLVPEAVRRVIRGAGDEGGAALVQATYGGRPGHPVLIGRAHWEGVRKSLAGDAGARAYLREHGAVEVECADLWSGEDIDSRA